MLSGAILVPHCAIWCYSEGFGTLSEGFGTLSEWWRTLSLGFAVDTVCIYGQQKVEHGIVFMTSRIMREIREHAI